MLPSAVVQGRKNPLHFGLSSRLKRARKAAGLTSAKLARLAGLTSPTTIYAVERGEHVPRADTIERLAWALGIGPCALAFGIEQTSNSSEGLFSAGLPQRLRDAHQASGLSWRDLAGRSETSVNCARMTASGTTMPNLANLEALAKALGVSPCWLAYGLGERALRPRRQARPTGEAVDQDL